MSAAPSDRPLRRLFARLARVRVPRGGPLQFVVASGVVALLLAVEAVTGVLLALYYRPTLASANDSVRFVITEVEYGDLVRGLHALASHALIASLLAIAAWALARRAWRAPNGLAWACGVALLLVCVVEAFTGTLLPWTRQSVVEAQISSSLVGHLPVLGAWLRRLLLGGDRAGDVALVRVLGVHAGALPMVATALAGLVTLHAAGTAPQEPDVDAVPLAPNAALRVTVAWAITAMLLLLANAAHPLGLGGSGGVATVNAAGVRPPWYLLAVHSAITAAPDRVFGASGIAVLAPVLVVAALLAVLGPALDRRGTRLVQVLGFVTLAALAGGTLRALL